MLVQRKLSLKSPLAAFREWAFSLNTCPCLTFRRLSLRSRGKSLRRITQQMQQAPERESDEVIHSGCEDFE